MIEYPVTLCKGGAVRQNGYQSALPLGHTKNRGVYRLRVTTAGEWQGLTIRAFWHTPGGADPPASLVENSIVAVPARVTARPGEGCITFEGTNGAGITVTSADLRYRVADNSGTEDGTLPEPNTPAWEAFVQAVQGQVGGLSQAEKQALLAVLRTLAAGNADALTAYNALALLWGGELLPTSDPLTARLGKAVLGKMKLGRR